MTATGTLMDQGNASGIPAGRWDAMELPSQPDSVPAARAQAVQVLHDWGISPEVIEDVRVVISELVTNSIRASAVLSPACPYAWI